MVPLRYNYGISMPGSSGKGSVVLYIYFFVSYTLCRKWVCVENFAPFFSIFFFLFFCEVLLSILDEFLTTHLI